MDKCAHGKEILSWTEGIIYECESCGNHVCRECAVTWNGVCPHCFGRMYRIS